MRLVPVIDRLKACGFKRVEGALEFAALDKAPTHYPAFFVLPQQEDANPNKMSGVHDQAATFSFGVVIMVGARASVGSASDELSELEEKVIDALAGWTPPEATRPCDYSAGRMLTVSASTVAWLVTFKTGRHIRKEKK